MQYSGSDVEKSVREQNALRGETNRINGQAFEFRVMRLFKRRSDVSFVIRSCGSHSPIDVIVQMRNKKQIWCTCKMNSYIEPRERLELSRVKQYQPDNVEIRLYYYISPKVMKWSRI